MPQVPRPAGAPAHRASAALQGRRLVCERLRRQGERAGFGLRYRSKAGRRESSRQDRRLCSRAGFHARCRASRCTQFLGIELVCAQFVWGQFFYAQFNLVRCPKEVQLTSRSAQSFPRGLKPEFVLRHLRLD